MATRTGRKTGSEPPTGQIRRSQVVGMFGPGALVDMVHDAGMVCGLERWRDARGTAEVISEPRLLEYLAPRLKAHNVRLSPESAFRLPPAGDLNDATRQQGIEVVEFPTWFVCQNPQCRALVRASSLVRKRDRYVHDCVRAGFECVPVRFVAACERGHLDDFDWGFFVHGGAPCSSPELQMREGASGDFASLVVACARCERERPLLDARTEQTNPRCRGRRPWLSLSQGDNEECECRQRLMVRTATHAYFGHVESSLSIPASAVPVDAVVGEHSSTLQVADQTTLPTFRTIPIIGSALADYSDAAVLEAIALRRSGRQRPAPELRRAEYEVFVSQVRRLDQKPREGAALFEGERIDVSGLPDGVERVVLAHRLREVRVQVGFTRLAAPSGTRGSEGYGDRMQMLSLNADWLPAVQIYGEGVFVRLDPERVARWEARPAVLERARALEQAIQAAQIELPGPIARFYLVHTLAHLLITAISLECGYAASAIRERLYVSPREDAGGMAAFLLSTGTPGTDGTLGGLVEQGRLLDAHLRRALTNGRLCSNDPVCGAHEPGASHQQTPDGAACHACVYVAEPSCEHFNRFLDRALVVQVVGAPPGLAFFGDDE